MAFTDLSQDSSHLAAEILSQPGLWESVVTRTQELGRLPQAGERVAVVGCGTSWFMAQAYAALRESSGQGITDACTATEFPFHREYDRVVALSRSGTTTEVIDVLHALKGKTPTVAVIGDPETEMHTLADQVVVLAEADEQSVVQTRFATSALSFFRSGLKLWDPETAVEARQALTVELAPELVQAEQYSFLGTGWTIGIANEAALKMREASQSWTESYSAHEYRHGPIAIAAPNRVTWAFGEIPDGLQEQVEATGARFEHSDRDPQADLIRVQRVALERARARGLNPDTPRHLTRSVILGG